MPPLFILAGVGAAALYGYRRMKKDAARLVERNRQSREEVRTGANGTLVRGDDGVYRIAKD